MRLRDILQDLLEVVEQRPNSFYRAYEEKGDKATLTLSIRYMLGGFYTIKAVVNAPGLPDLISKPHVIETYDFKRLSAYLRDYVTRINLLLDSSFFMKETVRAKIHRVEG